MTNINNAFPSKYLKASELQGQQVPVTMGRVEFEQLNGETKLILYFDGKQKGIVLNKTNAMTIGGLYGAETDGWFGKPIILFTAMVPFQGQTVPAIRVMPPPLSQTTAPPAPSEPPVPAAAPAGPADTMPSDDIPF